MWNHFAIAIVLVAITVVLCTMAVIVLLTGKRVSEYVKITIIILVSLSIISTVLWCLLPIDDSMPNMMEREALGFVHRTISDLRVGKVPPLARTISESDANEIRALTNHLPNGDYTVELYDQTAPYYYFRVYFPPNQCFDCDVEAYDSNRAFLAFFIQIEWKLRSFNKINCVHSLSN